MRIVAPFRPFPLEAPHHQELAAFDWMDAIAMMSESAADACRCDVHVLTDVDTALPFQTLKYRTVQRRLMLWYLEIAACYLESDDFDQDTVMLDSDQLIYGDLSRWFAPYMDLGICIRRTPKDAPGLAILNGVQFWAYRGRHRLADFYRRALAIAEQLSEPEIVWGADTVALERLLEPLIPGLYRRGDVRVRLIDSTEIIEALNTAQLRHLEAGTLKKPVRPVLDFRNTRKPHMRAVYEATLTKEVVQ